jgi:hypothetical protein
MPGAKETLESPEDGYEIRLQERLDDHWTGWFDGLKLTADPQGETVLSGPVPDQCALLSVLRKIHDLGLTLISVQKRRREKER